MAKDTTKNLTIGSPTKCIISFAIPMFLGMLFQQFYTLVDTMIVGKFLGMTQLAGVGSTGSLSFLIFGFCNGVSSGFAIPVAQMFGAKKESDLRKFVANSVWLGVIFAAVLTLFTVVFCRQLLQLLNTPKNIFEYAYIYILVMFAGIPFTFLYNMASGIIRALGDSKSPVIFLAISSVMNIGLDIFFITVFNMDVEGAALATVISQAFSGILSVIYIKRKFSILKINRDEWKFRWSYGKKLCTIGVPMGLQYSITAIGTLVITAAVNSFDYIAVAGTTAGQRIYGFLACPLEALGATMATYAGQNVGAKKFDRLTKGVVASSVAGFVVSAVLLLVIVFFGKPLSLLFLEAKPSEVEAALEYSYKFLLASGIGYSLLTLIGTFRFSIQGMGYSSFAIIAGILEMAARCIAGLLLKDILGYEAVAIANPLAWIMADAFLIPAFFLCKKRLEKRYGIR